MIDTIMLTIAVIFGVAMIPILAWFIINMYALIVEDIQDWLAYRKRRG
jgi:hypothetical protein